MTETQQPSPPEPAEDPQTSPAEHTPEPGQLPSEIDAPDED